MSLMGTPPTWVGMGEMAVARSPGSLEIRGLGSCIALALYDPLPRLAGLAHVVIPRPQPHNPPAPAWAATAAVPALLAAMEAEGARTNRLVARIAGGSSMFPGQRKGYDVGTENADVVEALLRVHGIPVLSRQLGGHASRNVRLDPEDGRLDVSTAVISRARRHAPLDDDAESVRVLLEAAASPLGDILERPVVVEPMGRHEFSREDLVAFLGAGTRMRWAHLSYTRSAREKVFHLAIPDLHARRLDAELRARLAEPLEEGAAIHEVLNVMASHGLTALAKMHREPLRPLTLDVRLGTTAQLLATMPRDAAPRAAHARLHLEGAFHGADLAIVGADLP